MLQPQSQIHPISSPQPQLLRRVEGLTSIQTAAGIGGSGGAVRLRAERGGEQRRGKEADPWVVLSAADCWVVLSIIWGYLRVNKSVYSIN